MRLAIAILMLWCPLLTGAEPPLKPVTVCEVLEDLSAYDGKTVAVVGRFSSRQAGRWLGEQKCAHKFVTDGLEWPNAFWVVYDPAAAPKPPEVLVVNSVLLAQKVREVKLGTALTKLPFGSSDYDNWALVYGRIETRKDLVLSTPGGAHRNGFGYGESSPARLVCHGDAVVIFLNEDATTPASP